MSDVVFARRFFGGIGTVALIYLPLRVLENYPAIFFVFVCAIISYGLGWLLDRSDS